MQYCTMHNAVSADIVWLITGPLEIP